jgi:hypothetical protein
VILLRIASDFHLEFFPKESIQKLADHFLPEDPRDEDAILCLAGDICSDVPRLIEFLEWVEGRFLHVIYVPGNHEYYRHDFDKWNADVKVWSKKVLTHVAAGEVRTLQLRDIRFIFGTLWGDGGDTLAEAQAINSYLNDFRLIARGRWPFTVEDMVNQHQYEAAAIAEALSTGGGPTVVITHHMPSYGLSHPRFGNECTGGFAGKCDDLLEGSHAPVLWIHGHTHDTGDALIGRTRVICNPAGYTPEWRTQFNSYFAAPKFVEVP